MHNHDHKYLVRPGYDLVPPGYKPQSLQMSHQGRPANTRTEMITQCRCNVGLAVQTVAQHQSNNVSYLLEYLPATTTEKLLVNKLHVSPGH